MTEDAARRYGELEAILAAAGALCDAAEAHGTLCGLICVHGTGAGELWLADIFAEPAAAEALAEEPRRDLMAMAAKEIRNFEDADFPFRLALPDDGEPLARRAEALGQWAQGFLHGLAVAGESGSLRSRLQSEPLAELVQDLSEITRAAGGQEEEAEADELAYAEVVEYLRVAAQLFYLELATIRADHHAAPRRLH